MDEVDQDIQPPLADNPVQGPFHLAHMVLRPYDRDGNMAPLDPAIAATHPEVIYYPDEIGTLTAPSARLEPGNRLRTTDRLRSYSMDHRLVYAAAMENTWQDRVARDVIIGNLQSQVGQAWQHVAADVQEYAGESATRAVHPLSRYGHKADCCYELSICLRRDQ